MKKLLQMNLIHKPLLKELLLIILAFVIISCSLQVDSDFPSSNNPIPVTPDMNFTQARFKTNFSGNYNVNKNAVLEIGIYNLKFSDGYIIETSKLADNFFVFNIIYTNNILTKGIKKIFFTNGMWDGVGNYQSLEILNSEDGTMHNLMLTLIEDPTKNYAWREEIKTDGTYLYFLGTNIGTKK